MSFVAIGAGAAVFALRALASHTVTGSFVFALGVMVALVPEGLPATMSVSLAIAVRRMARRHALIKRLTAVEGLGSTTVICTDKTGTLTKAEMTAQVVWESGRHHAISGVGYAPDGEITDPGPAREALRVGARCCDARLLAPDPSARPDGGSSETRPRERSWSQPRRPDWISSPTKSYRLGWQRFRSTPTASS